MNQPIVKYSVETISRNGLKKPVLRWAGGKSWLLKDLHKFLPTQFNSYHEPFLGGGSVFFHLQPKRKSYLSDINPDLMNTYCQLRDNIENVIHILKVFHNTQEDYYRIRGISFSTPAERAAQFVYLNKTCFNGLYRVNMRGKFNVPYGFRRSAELFNYDELKRSSELLKYVVLKCVDFEDTLQDVRKCDLIFLDPPYSVTHIRNGFVSYNEKLFSRDDQKRLASYIEEIHRRGAYYILSNAKHDSIKTLFGEIAAPVIVSRASTISGKDSGRGTIEEYIFTNVR